MRVSVKILLSGLVAATALAAGQARAGLDAEAAQRLAAWQAHPPLAGERVYTGQVRELQAASGPVLFVYERRVADTAQGRVASHITSEPSGDVVIVEQAEVDAQYGLRRFEAINRQTGQSGSVLVSADGHRLSYRRIDNGVTSSATEGVTEPLVTGPSLHGFILQRWAALAQGQTLAVRFIVLGEMRTYGFDIALAGHADGQTRFSVTPSRWWVRLALAPLIVTFDERRRELVRYEGRVPPAVLRDGRLRALDARVDYAMAVPSYR